MRFAWASPTWWGLATAISIVLAGRPRPSARPLPGAGPRPVHRRRLDPTIRWWAPWPSVERRASALAVWCDGVARSLRSGASLADAVDEAGVPEPGALEPDDLATITALAPALRRAAPLPRSSSPSGELALVLSVIAACREHGGPAAEPIDRAASVLRGRAAEAADRATHSAQARLSARVMTLLPVALLALLLATSPSVRAATTTPGGGAAIAIGGALNAVGWWWQRRLVQRAAA